MTNTIRTVAATILLALPLATPSLAAQEVELRWKYDEGEQLVYRITIEQEMELPQQGQQSSTQVQTLRWSVDEVDENGDATVSVTTDRMEIHQVGPTGSIDYDSETTPDSASPQAAMFGAMADASYSLVIAPDGTVKEVRGLQEMIDGMIAGLPPEAAAASRGMFEQMFSEESITNMMQQSIQSFPEGPVAPSDTWETSYGMPMPMIGEMTTDITFTLDEVVTRDGRQVAVISSAGTVTFGEAEGPMAGMMEMGSAAVTGSLDFDVERGHLLSGTSATSMTMELSSGGREMTMETTTTSLMELVEYLPPTGM